MHSSRCCGIELVTVEPIDPNPSVVYYVLNSVTGKLGKIIINGITVYEVE